MNAADSVQKVAAYRCARCGMGFWVPYEGDEPIDVVEHVSPNRRSPCGGQGYRVPHGWIR